MSIRISAKQLIISQTLEKMKKSRKSYLPLIITIISMLLFVGSILGNLVSTEIEDEIKMALGSNYRLIIILLFLGLTIISGYFTLFQWKQQDGIINNESLRPIKSATLNELRDGLGMGGKVNWIDRNILDINQLRANGRVVITGKMKLGKTREAVELIQKAIDNELIDSNFIYKPNTVFFSLNQKVSLSQLNIEPEHPILLFIDDLPYHFSDQNLKLLGELLDELKICKDLFIIATARSDQLREEHNTWLTSQSFHTVTLPSLDEAQTGYFVDNASKVFGLQIDNDARSIFIRDRDGTPELILMEMRNLGNEGIKQVTKKVAQNITEKSISAAWLETRRYIEKQKPAAKYLFESLAVFYSARLPPNTDLVLFYANELWKEGKTGKKIWRKTNQLWQALDYLRQFEINNRNGTIIHSDFVAENSIDIVHAQNSLGTFFLHYRKIYRNPILRHIYRQSTAQAIALNSLGNDVQKIEGYEDSEKYYQAAIKFYPHWAFYYNLGRLYILLNRSDDAFRIVKKAIKKNPNDYGAVINLGVLLIELRHYKEAEDACNQAIHIDPNNALAYSNLGHVLQLLGSPSEAETACRKAINLRPNFAMAYNNLGMALGDLGQNEEALAAFNKAIELVPTYSKAYTNKVLILHRLGRHDEALKTNLQSLGLSISLHKT